MQIRKNTEGLKNKLAHLLLMNSQPFHFLEAYVNYSGVRDMGQFRFPIFFFFSPRKKATTLFRMLTVAFVFSQNPITFFL